MVRIGMYTRFLFCLFGVWLAWQLPAEYTVYRNLVCLSCCDTAISMPYDSPPPRGASRPVPGRAPLHSPRSLSWARHPLCTGDRDGLLCGWDVAPQRDRGRPSGARESQLFFGRGSTRIFSKIRMTTTTSQADDIIRIVLS